MTLPKGYNTSAAGPKKMERQRYGHHVDAEENHFLLERIESNLRTYGDILEIAKQLHATNSDSYLSILREVRNNFVSAAAFIATIIIAVGILASSTNCSNCWQKNPIVDTVLAHSYAIIGGAIIFAVALFIAMNLWHRAVQIRLNAVFYGFLSVTGLVNTLRGFISHQSIELESIEPNQLKLFLRFIKVVFGNRTSLFDATLKASTFKLFAAPTKQYYRIQALGQSIIMDEEYKTYSLYRDEFFKEREFLKDVLFCIESLVMRGNKANKILEDPLMDFAHQYQKERLENFNKRDLLREWKPSL